MGKHRQDLQQIRPERDDKTTLVDFILFRSGGFRELADWGYCPDAQERSLLIRVTSQQLLYLYQERLKYVQPTDYGIIDGLLMRYNIQYNPPNFTLPQKCLLWAERGRSRILAYQLQLTDKLLQDAPENKHKLDVN